MRNLRRNAVAGVVLLVVLSSVAWADGKMFSPVAVQVNIPDQSAILCFDGQTERLIISTAYEAPGTDFAWVVPTPAVPKVEAVSTGVIPTLRMFCRPLILRGNTDKVAAQMLFVASVLLLLILILPKNAVAICCGMAVLLIILTPIYSTTTAASGLMEGLAGGVSVHSRERVGAYDVAVVSATTAEDLLGWLRSNGYRVDEAVRPALADYIRDGWCFTAYKVTRDTSGGNGDARTHPLSFTFPTARAVYPMRLTGVGNGTLSLELFVLGAQQAELPGFECKRSMRLVSGRHGGYRPATDVTDYDPAILRHEEAIDIIAPYAVLTLLTATLPPEKQRGDFHPDWRAPTEYRPTLRSRSDAEATVRLVATNALLIAAAAGVVLMSVRAYRKAMSPGGRFAAFLTAGGCLVFAQFFILSAVRVNPSKEASAVLCLIGLGVMVVGARYTESHPDPRRWPFDLLGIAAILVSLLGTAADSQRTATAMAAAGPAALAVLSLCADWYCGPAEVPRRKRIRLETWCLLGCMTAFLASWAIAHPLLTRGAVEVLRMDTYGDRLALYREANKDSGQYRDILLAPLPEARKAFARAARSLGTKNPYTGAPIREEKSPGNYTIEKVDGGNAIYYYELSGAVGDLSEPPVRKVGEFVGPFDIR
jgi:hypothetical protein